MRVSTKTGEAVDDSPERDTDGDSDGDSERRSITRRLARPLEGLYDRLEHRIAERLAPFPYGPALAKLLVITPLIFLALRQVDVLPKSEALIGGLVALYFVADVLASLVARGREESSKLGRVLDRAADYPLLVVVAWFSRDAVAEPLLLAKLGVDLLLIVLYVFGRGSSETRLRSVAGYATIVVLLLVSQAWAPKALTPRVAEYVLVASIVLSSTAVLLHLGFLQKRFIADALSAANLLCGVFSMVFASRGRFDVCLLFVLLGAAFDGFDGAAARRWGGTRIGVYSDDVADGVNYGIAPGVALYYALGAGPTSAAIGLFYAVFTISRLVFFTLEKSSADPNYFRGVPSPVGGITTIASIVVFEDHPELIGLMVGIAVAQMVSFSTNYRHLGRAVGGWVSRRRRSRGDRSGRRALFGAPVYVLVLLLGIRMIGLKGATSIILVANLVYGFVPTVLAFRRALSLRASLGEGEGEGEGDEEQSAPDPDRL